MANEPYDKDSDEQNSPIPGGNRESLDRDSLRSAEDNQSDDLGAGTTPKTDGSSLSGLKEAEETAPSPSSEDTTPEEDDGLYNSEGDNGGRFGGLLGGGKNGRRARSKLFGKAAKNKLLVGSIAGASTLLILLIILVAVLIGAYKAVDVAEHISAYEFARVTSTMAEDTAAVDSEKIGLEAIPRTVLGDELWDNLKTKFTAAGGQASALWSSLDDYRPDKIVSNWNNIGKLSFNESQTKLGRTYINSVTLNKVTYELQTKSFSNALKNNLIPGYKFANDATFSRDFAPDLIEALEANQIGPITRARVASQIRSDLDISLTAWLTGRFLGKSQDAANAELERESTAVAQGEQLSFLDNPGVTAPPVAQGPSDAINNTATAAEQALENDLSNSNTAQAIVNNPNQTPSDVAAAIAGGVASQTGPQGIVGAVLGYADPLYKWGVPLCFIYDGSIQQSKQTMDAQSQQLERSGIWLQTAAAQLKDGTTASGEVDGAVNWKLNDVTLSNAEMRSNGYPVDTTTYDSTEASPTGQYTYSLSDFLPGVVGTVAGALTPPICSVITNVWAGVGLGALNIGQQILLALTGDPEESTIENAAEGAMDAGMNSQLTLFDADSLGTDAAANSPSLLTRVASRVSSGVDFAKNFTKTTAKTVLATAGATLIARQLVASEMGGAHSPIAVGPSYVNDADDGTNIYANQIEQQCFYGAPLSDQNLAQDNAQDQAQLVIENSKQPAYDRYFALSNANSLVSRLLIDASAYMNSSFLASLIHFGSTILDPVRTMGSIFTPIISQSSYAAATVTSANTFYGNIQFGFTPYEQSLINNDSSYALLENQLDLDKSGLEPTIQSTYGACFTQSVGDMLANGDIQRLANGDVDPNHGLCSPGNLGTNNYTYHDLVFRWRVAEGYNCALGQLTDEQTVTASDTTTPTTPSGPTTGSISAYQNPFRKVSNLGTDRVDEGVDFTGSGPVYAIGTGTVVNITNSGWPGGTFIVYKLTDPSGAAYGKYVYMAENCNNIQVSTTPPKNQVTSSTVLCTMVNSSPHIETGWANGSSLGDALAKPVYVELSTGASYSTAYGQNFREFLTSIGETSVSSCYDFPGAALSGEPLPSSWPTWTTNPATKSGPNACPVIS